MNHLLLAASLLVAPLACVAQQQLPAANKIAMLDAQRPLKSDAPAVKRADKALQAAHGRCGVTAEKMADWAVVVQQGLTESGHAVTVVEILEAVDASLVDVSGKVNCVVVLGHYATLRNNGVHHALAVVRVRSLQRDFLVAEKK